MPSPAENELPWFDPNKSLWSQFTASRLNAMVGYMRTSRIVKGVGYDFAPMPGGTSLTVKPGKGGGSTTSPFKVSLRTDPTDPGSMQFSIELNSSLLREYVLSNRQTITGLDTWTSFDNGNDLIWLDITIDPDTGLAITATVNSYGLGGTWAPDDLPGEYGSGHGFFEYQLTYDDSGNSIFTQYLARIAIFSSVTSTDSPYPITNSQLLNTHLRMEGDIYSGALFTDSDGPAVIGLVMPKPYAGPFVQTGS